MYTLLIVIFIITVVLLIPVILMQSGSGAEAGMFGSNLTLGAFGAKSSEALVKMTQWLIAIFFVSAFLIGYIKIMETKQLMAQQKQAQTVDTNAAAAPATDTNAAAAQPATDETLPAAGLPAASGETLPTVPGAAGANSAAPAQLPNQ